MLIKGVNLQGLRVTDVPSVVTTNLQIFLDGTTYTSGITWTDSTGNGNNYTLVNSPTFSNGVFTLNGSTQYIMSPDLNANYAMGSSAATNWTFEVWARPSGVTNSGILIDETGNPNQSGWHDSWMEFAGGNIRISVWSNGAGISLGAYTANNWYQIVMAYNGTTLYGYVNGALQNSAALTRSIPGGTIYYPLGGPADITNLGNGSYYSGGIGAMRYYNRALTATEVLQNFRNLRNRYGI